jgi:2-methylisocitrate lyase-like PEP mutase family enzyme
VPDRGSADAEAREIYEIGLASQRVAAAAEASHSGDARLVLTGRAENFFRGHADLADTITRLQAHQEAGADVLYAPGLTALTDIRSVVESVDRPVNVLARPNGPSAAELASVGVARVSVGGRFTFAALGAAVNAARELLEEGTYSLYAQTRVGRREGAASLRLRPVSGLAACAPPSRSLVRVQCGRPRWRPGCRPDRLRARCDDARQARSGRGTTS